MGRIKAPRIFIINKKTTNYNTMKFALALIAALGSALKIKQTTTDTAAGEADYNCMEGATMHVVAGLDTDGDWKVSRDEFQIIIDEAGFDDEQLAAIESFFADNESADVMAAMEGFSYLLESSGVPQDDWCNFLYGVGDQLHGIPPPMEQEMWDEAGCEYGNAECVFGALFYAIDDNMDGSLDQAEFDDVTAGLKDLGIISEDEAAEASAWFAGITGDGDATMEEVGMFLREQYMRDAEERAYHDLLDAYRIATHELGEWDDQVMDPSMMPPPPADGTASTMDTTMPPPPAAGTAGPMDTTMPPPPAM